MLNPYYLFLILILFLFFLTFLLLWVSLESTYPKHWRQELVWIGEFFRLLDYCACLTRYVRDETAVLSMKSVFASCTPDIHSSRVIVLWPPQPLLIRRLQ